VNVHGRKVLQQFQIGGKVSREQLVSQQDDHGAAHVDKVVEAALVGEERVPDAHDVGQFKFLRQQQGQPPKREELRLELLVLEPVPHLRVAFFDFGHQPVHQSVDAHLALVQRFDEVVANLRHQTSEAEERVRFGVLCEKKKKKKRKKRTNE